ncbi:cytochrome c-type biogenesis protein CcmH [Marivivens sp. LCG002]|uniref:cytochrome c-type biogenesis protein n=1 Tax=Marivivens sp. LCG002 TaxID=3051171 RepID=UPI0025552588|nr:cytochrome c-type biogenesis protein [Marivivens sp. LCG002]WIV51905.1 cytochrome c-type biogenesis protein CcmH [Marivivens sp. LCG002]
MKRFLILLAFLATPLYAVQPDEILSDPALEARAREISQGLRCPVCQNENIDDSNAPISRELRILLRERLVEGDTDQEVVDFIVARYGEYVLLEPVKSGANLILWWAAPLMLVLAGGIGFVTVRNRATAKPEDDLSEDEQKRLREILDA